MRNIERENDQITHNIGMQVAKCAVCVVLMVVASFIRIPIPYVPLTFQTVVAVLAGLLLGVKWGAASMFIYLFMGLVGLPVFSGGGGFSYVLQLTFGYIVGFVAAAFVVGLIRGDANFTFRRAIVSALVGVVVNYIFGVFHFSLIWSIYMEQGEIWQALLVNNILFFPKDLFLCFLAASVALRIRKGIRR